MADSSLVTVERLTSTKCRKNRIDNSGVKHTVDTITIHCTAGNKNSTAAATVSYWTNNNVDASSQYVVGGDGSVCQNVLEADRAWTTGGLSAEQMKNMGRNYETGSANDYHAITIEVASNSSGTEVTETYELEGETVTRTYVKIDENYRKYFFDTMLPYIMQVIPSTAILVLKDFN